MKSAFIKTVEQHQGIIYKVSKMYRDTPQDQEDLYQDIVLQLWKSYPDFRGESKIGTWMYRIALNTALARFRKSKPAVEYKENISHGVMASEDNPEKDNEEQLFASIRRLKKADRSILALYLEAYSYREIGEIIGISEAYVAVKIGRIKTQLKQIITGLDNGY